MDIVVTDGIRHSIMANCMGNANWSGVEVVSLSKDGVDVVWLAVIIVRHSDVYIYLDVFLHVETIYGRKVNVDCKTDEGNSKIVAKNMAAYINDNIYILKAPSIIW